MEPFLRSSYLQWRGRAVEENDAGGVVNHDAERGFPIFSVEERKAEKEARKGERYCYKYSSLVLLR